MFYRHPVCLSHLHSHPAHPQPLPPAPDTEAPSDLVFKSELRPSARAPLLPPVHRHPTTAFRPDAAELPPRGLQRPFSLGSLSQVRLGSPRWLLLSSSKPWLQLPPYLHLPEFPHNQPPCCPSTPWVLLPQALCTSGFSFLECYQTCLIHTQVPGFQDPFPERPSLIRYSEPITGPYPTLLSE